MSDNRYYVNFEIWTLSGRLPVLDFLFQQFPHSLRCDCWRTRRQHESAEAIHHSSFERRPQRIPKDFGRGFAQSDRVLLSVRLEQPEGIVLKIQCRPHIIEYTPKMRSN